jgi:arylsulfatase A-like enzyme
MDGANPWHTWANSGQDTNEEIASGWYYRNAHLPTRAPDEHGETAYMTRRAMDFMEEQGDKPWMLHLSYIKPHWPYIVQAPYHNMYGRADIQQPIRSVDERINDHPVYQGYRLHPEGIAFSRDADRLNVIPAYMGLVKQVDDHLGKLLAYMQDRGLMENTLIVFTADHGDYLGDHWLGEKEFMHEQGVRIPLIISDPSAQETHGTVSQALAEAVDLLPTFMETMGVQAAPHWLEGKSLRPILDGRLISIRDVAVSELDYAIHGAARRLKLGPREARMVMARSDRFKYIHYDGLAPQLFDLQEDPLELKDLGRDSGYASVREEHFTWIFDWMRQRRNRVTISDETIMKRATPASAGGVVIGEW